MARHETAKRPISWTPHEIPCALCGKPFMAHHNRCKYCVPCRKKKELADRKARDAKKTLMRKKRAEEEGKALNGQIDNDKQVLICLNCDEKDCKYGTCQKVRAAGNVRENTGKRLEMVREFLSQNMTVKQIVEETGWPQGTVYGYVRRLEGENGDNDKTLAEIRRLASEGYCDTEIMRKTGKTRGQVRYWRIKEGISIGKKGKQNGNSRKMWIFYDRQTSEYLCEGTVFQCAAALGLTVSTVRSTISRWNTHHVGKYEIHEAEDGI